MSAENIPPPVGHRAESPDAFAPDGSEIRLLLGTPEAATRASLCEVSLGPRQVSRPVWHRTVEEFWYILEGSGSVWRRPPDQDPSDVQLVEVGPGDALTIPTRWNFQFAAGPDGLRFLCFTSPPWPGEDEAQPASYGGLGAPTV